MRNTSSKKFTTKTLAASMIPLCLGASIFANADTTLMHLGGQPWVLPDGFKNTEAGRNVARSGIYTIFGAEFDKHNPQETLGSGSMTIYADGIANPVGYYAFQSPAFIGARLGKNVAISDNWVAGSVIDFTNNSSSIVIIQKQGNHWKTCPTGTNGYTDCDGALTIINAFENNQSEASLKISGNILAAADVFSNTIKFFRLQSLGDGSNVSATLINTLEIPVDTTLSSFDISGNDSGIYRLAISTKLPDGFEDLYIYHLNGNTWTQKNLQEQGGGQLALDGNKLAVTSKNPDLIGANYTAIYELNSNSAVQHSCILDFTPGGELIDISGRHVVVSDADLSLYDDTENPYLKVFSQRLDGRWILDGALDVPSTTRSISSSNGKVASGLWQFVYEQEGKQAFAYGGAFATALADARCPQTSSELKPISATASSTENGSLTANKAFDGNEATRWSSAFVNEAWISFDFGRAETLKSMTINWETAFSKKFLVQISNDNFTWNRAYITPNGEIEAGGQAQTIQLHNLSGRYVRIKSLERATQWGVSIKEVTFNSAAATQCPETPIALSCSGTPSNAITSGVYRIKDHHSLKHLDVAGASPNNNANVQIWQYAGGANQRFNLKQVGNNIFTLESQHTTGKCIDIEGAATWDWANVQQYQCNGTNAQRFTLHPHASIIGAYEIKNVNSQKCLTVQGSQLNNGSNVNQMTCAGMANQLWWFE